MLPRSLIKSSLDDWMRWAGAARRDMVARRVDVIWPKGFALALTGVRRSGKTFLALDVASRLSKQLLYFNFEDPIFVQDNDVGNLDTIVSVYTEYLGHEPGVIIFDEIQNVAGWERWVRKCVDTQRWPLIITGSSAKLLSSEIATSISGRCIEQHVWPLSFHEFLSFSGTTCTSPDMWLSALRRYMNRGGFPAVVQEPDDDAKRLILQQYLSDMVLKDVIDRHEIRAKRSLDQIVLFAMTNVASLFSYQSMRKAFGMTVDLAHDYVRYLNDAFILFEVPRFHQNLKVQARDSRKMYVIDTGLRNVHARSIHEDLGKQAENIVYIELRRRKQEIFYYQEQGEVDFITTSMGKPDQAFQVCYSDMTDEATFRREYDSLRRCMKNLHLTVGHILTLNREESLVDGGDTIKLMPIYKFLSAAHDAP